MSITSAKNSLAIAAQQVRGNTAAASYVPEQLLAGLTTNGVSASEHQQLSDIYLKLLGELPNNGQGFKEVERLYTETENLVGLQAADATSKAISAFFKKLF